MENLELVIGLVVAVLAIIGTNLGILMPMLLRLEKKIDTVDQKFTRKFEYFELRLDAVHREIIDVHREITGIHRRLPADAELLIARR